MKKVLKKSGVWGDTPHKSKPAYIIGVRRLGCNFAHNGLAFNIHNGGAHVYTDAFVLGVFIHGGLLLNAVYQNAFMLSHGLSHKSAWGIALVFSISGIAAALIGIYGLHSIVGENEIFEKALGLAGVLVLLYHAFRAYKSAKHCKHHSGKSGGIVVALAMVWLTPHVYTDMFMISSVAITRPAYEYPALIAGFGSMGFLWFSSLALFTKRFTRYYKNKRVHTTMHYASAVILTLAAITTLVHTFFEEAHH